jgi:hypothetical protein
VELDDHGRFVIQPLAAGREQTAVWLEAVAGGEDGVGGLLGEVGIAPGVGGRKIGRFATTRSIDPGTGSRRSPRVNGHAIAQAVAANVLAREHDRARAGIGREDAHVRRGGGNCDRDRPDAGADVDDESLARADVIERSGDQLFRSLAVAS